MDLRKEIIEELLKHSILVEPDVVDFIIERGGKDYLPHFIEEYRSLEVVTLSSLKKEKKAAEKTAFSKPEASEYEWDFKVLMGEAELKIKEGGIEDFRSLFLDRYKRLARILRTQTQLRGYTEISKLRGGEVKVIGMVDEIRITSRGSLIFTLEDPSGRVECYYPEGSFLLNDEVIGVVGNYSENNDRIYVKEILRPGVPIMKKNRKIAENISVAIISDTHIGSKMFLESRWKKFLEWLKRGKGDAAGIKYLLIGGDLVDGIGIYPNQEEELEILDIYNQYEKFAKYLEEVPDYIKIVMIPGNHDIVRNTEPQPVLPEEVRKMFNGNVEFLPNPGIFSIHGYKFLMYHGTSLNDLVEMIPGMSYERIDEIMKYMLEARHLAPTYGSKVSIAPLPRDFLTIDIVPDVFITGHVHAFTYTMYKNIHLINASCWQSQTKYQKMMNFNPDPGKVAILNLHTDKVKVLSF